jgi:hypothetical protein
MEAVEALLNWNYEAIAEALESSLRILQNHIVLQQRLEAVEARSYSRSRP